MDGYQLTAVIFQCIAAFAWPIALIVVAAMFRKDLSSLLPALRGKLGETEFWFEKVEEEAKSLPQLPQSPEQATLTAQALNPYNELARISPQAAMLELRAFLDDRLRSLAAARGIDQKDSIGRIITTLQTEGVIDSQTAALLHNIRVMGNTAAHSMSAFSETDAHRYKGLVDTALKAVPSQ